MDDKQNQPKRRGRKPKGGKVISDNTNKNNISTENKKTAVIVHIKCTTNDLKEDTSEFTYDPTIETIYPYSDIINESKYEIINELNINVNKSYNNNNNNTNQSINYDDINKTNNVTSNNSYNENYNYNISSSTIEGKLKDLSYKLEKMDLHNNTNHSSCFWCTYNFDNIPIHIPTKINDDTIFVYGCFCSPQCALAYLLKELIDDTTKIERIYLLNYIYGKVHNYCENIKPALDPHYTLNKFFGNLTINEYRSMYNLKKKYTIINKPLTLINPELNEDTQHII